MKKKEFIYFESPIDFPENISDLYNKFKSLSQENLRKFIRACECYQEALLVSTNNPTISFFLFVVCIECLSNKDKDFFDYLKEKIGEETSKIEIKKIYNDYKTEYGLCRNFIQFILSHFDEWEKDGFSIVEFQKFLSSIYEIRCTFTHEGKNLDAYVKLISGLKSKSVFTNINDKDIEFPRLDYLSKVVRKVLINFLEKQDFSNSDNIPKFALVDDMINLILRNPAESIKKMGPIVKSQIKVRE